jgi:hypothetical protein
MDQYFEALGISKLADLLEGHGKPNEDEQVMLGLLFLSPLEIFPIKPTFNPFLLCTVILPFSIRFQLASSFVSFAMSSALSQPAIAARISHCVTYDQRTNLITIVDNQQNRHFTVHPAQLRTMLQFDFLIRRQPGKYTGHQAPLGFPTFSDIFNRCANTNEKVAYLTDNGYKVDGPPVDKHLIDLSMINTRVQQRDPALETLGIVDHKGATNHRSVATVGRMMMSRIEELERRETRNHFAKSRLKFRKSKSIGHSGDQTFQLNGLTFTGNGTPITQSPALSSTSLQDFAELNQPNAGPSNSIDMLIDGSQGLDDIDFAAAFEPNDNSIITSTPPAPPPTTVTE